MPRTPVRGVSVKDIQLVGVATGTLADKDGGSVRCDAHVMILDDDGNEYYLPLYDTVE